MFLITGGNGFIGRQLARRLQTFGKGAVLFDLVPPENGSEGEGVPWVQGNILHIPELVRALQQYSVQGIIHLASYRNVQSQQNPYAAFRLNVEGTMNVLEAARLAGCRRLVFASTVAVYGSPDYYRNLGLDPFRITENYPVHPGNVYGATKSFCEQMLSQYGRENWLEPVAVRLPIIIGPGKKAGSQTSVFNDIIENALFGRPSRVVDYAGQMFNFMYVKDAAEALAAAAVAPAPVRTVYNCGGERTDVAGLVRAVRTALPEAMVEVAPSPENRPWSSAIVDDLARAELGYTPRFSLEEAVRDYRQALA